MRELSVYYCPKCGFYGYYQLSKNAVCPKCDTGMIQLQIRYQDFMDLDCRERDELLANQIMESSSIVSRLMAPHKAANNREIIAHLTSQIEELEIENQKLNSTVEWMHQTIWNLLSKYKKEEQIHE